MSRKTDQVKAVSCTVYMSFIWRKNKRSRIYLLSGRGWS